jgi:hypothetical protein
MADAQAHSMPKQTFLENWMCIAPLQTVLATASGWPHVHLVQGEGQFVDEDAQLRCWILRLGSPRLQQHVQAFDPGVCNKSSEQPPLEYIVSCGL